MAYTPAEADRILFNSASDAIKRMSDSQIDAVSKKLQEYYLIKEEKKLENPLIIFLKIIKKSLTASISIWTYVLRILMLKLIAI